MKATTAQLLIDQQKKIDELERAIGDIMLACILDNHVSIRNDHEKASDAIVLVQRLKEKYIKLSNEKNNNAGLEISEESEIEISSKVMENVEK